MAARGPSSASLHSASAAAGMRRQAKVLLLRPCRPTARCVVGSCLVLFFPLQIGRSRQILAPGDKMREEKSESESRTSGDDSCLDSSSSPKKGKPLRVNA